MLSITSKTILNKTRRRDPWFLDDYTVNPYSGCSFNCTFCYIRGSKYGEHMEQKLGIKINAVELLDKQLGNRAKKGQYGIIVLSSATDPYLQAEKDTGLTRQLLDVVRRHRFPLHVITRSDLVLRDLDLLGEIDNTAILPSDLASATRRGVFITFSFSALDPAIVRIFEPGATNPLLRLDALRKCVDKGFHTGVSLMPLLPEISDTQAALDNFYETFASAGSKYVLPASLTLFGTGPSDSMTLTLRAIEKNFPDKIELYRQLYNTGFRPPKSYLLELNRKLELARRRHPISDRIISIH